MTATEKLRNLLDEWDIEWWGADGMEDTCTMVDADNVTYTYLETRHGLDVSAEYWHCEEPEKAVAATMGGKVSEERACRNDAPEYLDFLCSACGFVHYHGDENDDGDGNTWNYCPNCGRRVFASGTHT